METLKKAKTQAETLSKTPNELKKQGLTINQDGVKRNVLDERQARDIAAFRRDEGLRIPDGFNYGAVGGLSNEVRSKLESVRPATLGQAARIEGVTPGALTAVLAFVRKAS